jgi:DNA-binding CsgD family transcriptional regulator
MTDRVDDVRLTAEFLHRLHTGGSRSVEHDTIDLLRRLVPCDLATYREFGARCSEVTSGFDPAEVTPIWARYDEFRDDDPLPGITRTPHARYGAPPGVAVRSSDVVEYRVFRNSGFFSQMCRPLGTRYILKLFIDAPYGTAGIVLESSSRDFSARDVAVATALAPHFRLAQLRTQPVALPGGAIETLSAREREVARLVATGMTNRQIAAVLFVSPGTVRKHLDNIYAKTGARNRTVLAGSIR